MLIDDEALEAFARHGCHALYTTESLIAGSTHPRFTVTAVKLHTVTSDEGLVGPGMVTDQLTIP